MNKKVTFGVLAGVTVSLFSACFVPKEEEERDYTCNCTYIPDALGPTANEPQKTETSTVRATNSGEANVRCANLESKYSNQFFSGTCIVQ
jgi:hypothetical protein